MIGSLDGTPARELMRNKSHVEIAGDHLWFIDRGTLVARPFDATRELFTGEALPIAEGVGELGTSGTGLFSVSKSGVLAFHGPESAKKRSLTWRDRSGQTLGTLGPPARHLAVKLAPNGEHAATTGYVDTGFLGIWLHDVATEISTRFTFEAFGWPVWSPDGDRIALSPPGSSRVEVRPVFGGADGEISWEADAEFNLDPYDWSPDGSVLLASAWIKGKEINDWDIWVLPLDKELSPYPLFEMPFQQYSPALSPDGHWLAYVSDESDRGEVYVTAFPDRGRKWQISEGGGEFPLWSQRGDELFYLDLRDVVMAVPIDLQGGSFVPGSEAELFQTRLSRRAGQPFAASPDAGRFLTIERHEGAAPSQIHLLVGWKQLIERRGDQ
jgi:hypothetical protein